MKNYTRFIGMIILSVVPALTACETENNSKNNSFLLMFLAGGGGTSSIDVAFINATQTGGASGTVNSTGLTLTFDVDPTTLTADNISIYGAAKGSLTGSGTTRSLAITDITVINGAPVYVVISNPAGYSISGSPRTAVVYRTPSSVTFQGAVQTGGTTWTADSTSLTLTFSSDPMTLTTDSITVTGATKGALTGTGTTRSLGISGITVDNGATVSVTITSPYGYSLSGSPLTAVVYRSQTPAIGMAYGGGKIAYVLVSGDAGYDAAVPHGLIAAAADQSTGIRWGSSPGVALSEALGTGSFNTDSSITVNGSGTDYAAGLARAYNGGGYTDWYLPSIDELYKLYLNQATIGGFSSSGYYWSSSFTIDFVQFAGLVYMGGGSPTYVNPSSTYRVRAVRSF